jgi:hypothetical protein
MRTTKSHHSCNGLQIFGLPHQKPYKIGAQNQDPISKGHTSDVCIDQIIIEPSMFTEPLKADRRQGV